MLTDFSWDDILRITGFRNIMSIPLFDFQHRYEIIESTDEINDPCLLTRNTQKSKHQNIYFSPVIIHCLTIL